MNSVYERKKRNKISYACSRCRKDKKKCDRKLPCCGYCSESGEIGDCKYDSDKWKTELSVYEPGNAQLRKELGILKSKIKSLENTISTQRVALDKMKRDREELDIYKQKDKSNLKINMHNFHILVLKHLRLTYFGPSNYISLFMNDPYGMKITANFTENQDKKLQEIETHDNLNVNVSKQNHIQSGTEDSSRILESLPMEIPSIPSHETLIYLIDRFFQDCYPLAPFLEKDNFIKNISPLWENGGYSGDNIIHLEYGPLASLLIILRFSALSLSPEVHITEKVGNIPSSYIEYSKKLLLSSKGSSEINLSTIQAILLLRAYKSICPEGDSESTDLLLGMAIDMGIHQGLSLSTTMNGFISEEELYIRKKLWLHLFYDDTSNSFNKGIQTSISDFEIADFDKLLQEVGMSVESEKEYILRQLRIKSQVASLIKKAVLLMNHKNEDISVFKAISIVNEFENLLHKEMYSFVFLINHDLNLKDGQTSYKVLEFIMKIDVYYKSCMLYYFLFLNWNNDISLDYSRTDLLHLALEKGIILTLLCDYFAKDTNFFFGSEFENLIGTCIWSSLAKIIPSILCLLCRSLDGEYNIFTAFENFKSSCFDLISWANIDHMDNSSAIKNIIKKYEELYQESIQLHNKYFITYKVSSYLHSSFGFLENAYPAIFKNLAPKDINFSEEFACFLDTDY